MNKPSNRQPTLRQDADQTSSRQDAFAVLNWENEGGRIYQPERYEKPARSSRFTRRSSER